MTNDVIFSRKLNNEPLTYPEVIERAPASMQFLKGSERGKHYAHINTSEAIDILADYGFKVTQAAQVKARTRSANSYAQHMLALSNPDYTSSEGTPQVVLFNSGDGKSALRMFAGFYRFICSNSLVAGSGFEVKASHSKATASTFEDMIKQTAKTFPAMLEQVERMKSIQVNVQTEQRLARQAVDLRWERLTNKHYTKEGFVPGIYSTPTTAASLIQVRRSGDMDANLWTTYNKIQEGLIRGGSDIFSITKRNPSGVNRKARPLNGVKTSLEVNRKLWDLVNNQAEVMA